jgi:hypothetical protein
MVPQCSGLDGSRNVGVCRPRPRHSAD